MKIIFNLDPFKDLPTNVRKLSRDDGAEFGDVLADLAKQGKHRHGKARDHFEVLEDERDSTVYPDDGFNGDAFDTVYSRKGAEMSTATVDLEIVGFPKKPRVKGIGEDGFRAILEEEAARRGRTVNVRPK